MLDELEEKIKCEIRHYKSDDILLSVHNALKELSNADSIGHRYFPQKLQPFIAAGTALFAIRFSNPHRRGKKIGWPELAKICHFVSEYLLADPIGFDKDLKKDFSSSNPIFVILRLLGSQVPFNYNSYACYSQSLMLYCDVASGVAEKKDVPRFDFHTKFEKIAGVSLKDLVSIGFVAFSASRGNTSGFTRGYFEKARMQGVNLPDDATTLSVLNLITATPPQIKALYEKMKVADRRFRAYDFNPLLSYPVLRPWKNRYLNDMDNDRLIAPVPALINYRISTGIYYQMFNEYKEDFSRWFGHVFEAYVGKILEKSILKEKLFPEEHLMESYKGKVPDYVIIDGTTLITIEAKATRLSRPAVSTASESDVKKSLEQIIKGLIQMYEFSTAIKNKAKGLEDFHTCTEIIPIFITHEYFYTINTLLFKKYIDGLLEKEGIKNFTWYILAVQQLEILQPHFTAGVSFANTMKELAEKTYNETLDKISKITGKTYKDSFLYQKDKELFERLGI